MMLDLSDETGGTPGAQGAAGAKARGGDAACCREQGEAGVARPPGVSAGDKEGAHGWPGVPAWKGTCVLSTAGDQGVAAGRLTLWLGGSSVCGKETAEQWGGSDGHDASSSVRRLL